MNGFIKLVRHPDVEELLQHDHPAFLLATWIAIRAKFRPGLSTKGLAVGEAMIGDWEEMGFRSRREYRTARDHLKDYGKVAYVTTSKGTIATLTDSTIYDLNLAQGGQQSGQQAASKRPAGGQQAATNEEGKKERREEGKTGNIGVSLRSTPRQELASADNGTELFAPEEVVTKPKLTEAMVKAWWNEEMCVGRGAAIPQVNHIRGKRWEKFKRRAAEGMWESRAKIVDKAHNQGEWSRERGLVTFDWIVKAEDNWQKLAEGNYDPRADELDIGNIAGL